MRSSQCSDQRPYTRGVSYNVRPPPPPCRVPQVPLPTLKIFGWRVCAMPSLCEQNAGDLFTLTSDIDIIVLPTPSILGRNVLQAHEDGHDHGNINCGGTLMVRN